MGDEVGWGGGVEIRYNKTCNKITNIVIKYS